MKLGKPINTTKELHVLLYKNTTKKSRTYEPIHFGDRQK
jgi:hypothetical protein